MKRIDIITSLQEYEQKQEEILNASKSLTLLYQPYNYEEEQFLKNVDKQSTEYEFYQMLKQEQDRLMQEYEQWLQEEV